jgi:hypothetical protein
MNGIVLYEGPSLLADAPIVAILTGLTNASNNPKTGPMLQAWVLRSDMPPMDAKRVNLDDAVCGDCALRGRDGFDAVCYVSPWQAPHQVYKAFQRDIYGRPDAADVRASVAGKHLRVTAYGDPAAVPYDVWQNVLTTAGGWVGYTHQHATCDPRLRWLLMASVESAPDAAAAHARGWRTFRARRSVEVLDAGEVTCPASDEAGHRVTCQSCQLCRGSSRPAKSIGIIAHGKPGNTSAFRRLHAVPA